LYGALNGGSAPVGARALAPGFSLPRE
jgi:hypothetical protein